MEKNILFILIAKHYTKTKGVFPKPLLKYIIGIYTFIESYEGFDGKKIEYNFSKFVLIKKYKDKINTIKKLIENQPNFIEIILDFDGCLLSIIDKQSLNICLRAVRQNGLALKFVKKQNYDICMEAVKQEGFALKYVRKKNQTHEICMLAVKQDGITLQYVIIQTPEICLEAVKNMGGALKYVKEQTLEICLEAIKKNKYALHYVKKHFYDLCLEAI